MLLLQWLVVMKMKTVVVVMFGGSSVKCMAEQLEPVACCSCRQWQG